MESLGLDWKLLLAQIANFGILYFVLKKVLYKPLIKLIDERNKKIKEAIANSQKIEEKFESLAVKEQKVMENARLKAKKDREELLSLANSEKDKIVEEAKISAKHEVEKGLQNIESAKKEAVEAISEGYLEEITARLYKKMSEKSKKENYPVLKTLLK